MGWDRIKANFVGLLIKFVIYMHFATAFYMVFIVREILLSGIYLIACIRTSCLMDGGVIVRPDGSIREFKSLGWKVSGKVFDIIFFVVHVFVIGCFIKSSAIQNSIGIPLMLYMSAHSAVHCWFCFRNFLA